MREPQRHDRPAPDRVDEMLERIEELEEHQENLARRFRALSRRLDNLRTARS
jgi:predicted transcriptional regulator